MLWPSCHSFCAAVEYHGTDTDESALQNCQCAHGLMCWADHWGQMFAVHDLHPPVKDTVLA
jgi:hypothetical protein